MSTTYTSATKDNSKDKDTDTYVRSSDTTTSSTDKSITGKNKPLTTQDTDKTHDIDTTSGYGKTQTGSSQQQYGVSSTQYGAGSDQQWGQRGSQTQVDVQQKLKEVGNLLQKAGHLLQDLQGSSTGDLQPSSFPRGSGGNYGGPYGGFESQQVGGGHFGSQGPYGGSQQQYGQPSSQFGRPSQFPVTHGSRYECERGPQFGGHWSSEDREERGFPSRGNIFSSRNEDRFESRPDRGNVDRYSGFGGPNRPDLAYGAQYGGQGGLGYEGRRGDFFESRRGGDRF